MIWVKNALLPSKYITNSQGARPECPSLIDTFAKANCAATSNRDFISGENTVNTNIKELLIKN